MSSVPNPNPDISKVRSTPPANRIPWRGGDWGPDSSFKYKVRYGDNWWTVANKDGWADPMDFIEYNFNTRNPREINWYLRQFVGCKHATQDGKNHVFTDNLNPGYVYTVHKLQEQPPPNPVPWADPPPIPPEEIKLARPGVWVGVGARGGAFAGVGYERCETAMFSPDFSDVYWMSIDTLKFGGGGGVAGGACLVVASGLPTLGDLKYCVINGRDWALSVGFKLKSIAQTAAGLGSIARLARSVRAGEQNWKILTEGVTGLKYVLGLTNSIGFGTMPTVTLIDIPFASYGAEISIYSSRSTFSVTTLRESDESLYESLKKSVRHAGGLEA